MKLTFDVPFSVNARVWTVAPVVRRSHSRQRLARHKEHTDYIPVPFTVKCLEIIETKERTGVRYMLDNGRWYTTWTLFRTSREAARLASRLVDHGIDFEDYLKGKVRIAELEKGQ